MSLRKLTVATVMALSGVVASSPSFAQAKGPAADTGFYVGGSLGQASVNDFCDGLSNCEDKDTAWRVFGGYQANRNFSVEVGYTDLGEVSGSFGASTVKAAATALELVGIGSFPVTNELSLYGKIGIYRGETDVTGTGLFSGSVSDSNTDLTFGVGIRYDFSRNLGLRAEWQRYSDFGGSDIGEADVDALSVGLVWKF